MNLIGKRVLGDTATIVGIQHGPFYVDGLKVYRDKEHPWDVRFPDWRKKWVLTVEFDNPVRPLSDNEIGRFLDMPVEYISNKLRDWYAPTLTAMCLPYEAVFPQEVSKNSDVPSV